MNNVVPHVEENSSEVHLKLSQTPGSLKLKWNIEGVVKKLGMFYFQGSAINLEILTIILNNAAKAGGKTSR